MPYVPAARIPCELCGHLIPAGSKTGICQTTPACRREYQRRFTGRNPLWQTYQGILHRCYNPGQENYERYGGRGIKMYEPWSKDYKAFQAWMDENLGPRPPGMTLDRIDNDGDYEPGNLKWSTLSQQWYNSRRIMPPEDRLRQQIRDLGAEPCC